MFPSGDGLRDGGTGAPYRTNWSWVAGSECGGGVLNFYGC